MAKGSATVTMDLDMLRTLVADTVTDVFTALVNDESLMVPFERAAQDYVRGMENKDAEIAELRADRDDWRRLCEELERRLNALMGTTTGSGDKGDARQRQQREGGA